MVEKLSMHEEQKAEKDQLFNLKFGFLVLVTLKNKKDFENVYKSPKKWHNPYFILFFKENLKSNRVGFCVSKKVGNAVCRNFVKRRLRNLYRNSMSNLVNGDMVLLAKNGLDKAPYSTLQSSYSHALMRLKLLQIG